MTVYVALLRGVNVGRNRRIAMADLRTSLAELGYDNVHTYLQSRNVVFVAPEEPEESVASAIEHRLVRDFGMNVGTVVRTAEQLDTLIGQCPVEVGDPTRFLVLFLSRKPDRDRLARMDTASFAPEEMGMGERDMYFSLPEGVRNARLPAFAHKHVSGPVTTRNWNTATRLHALAHGSGERT